MRKRKHNVDGKGALVLLGEAFHLLRHAPLSLLVAYYMGTVPFVLAALFFWTDMSYSASARERCAPAALLLAVLFIWMKCWQTVFASGMRTRLSGLRPDPWTPSRVLRTAAAQLAVQAHALWLLPLSLLVPFTFPAVCGFFQTVTVYGDGTHDTVKGVLGRAAREARRWPGQSWGITWLVSPWLLGAAMLLVFGAMHSIMSNFPETHELQGPIWFGVSLLFLCCTLLPLCPFGAAVAGNIALVLALVPFFMRRWFGIETVFSASGTHGVFNTTFIMTVYVLTFLCLDPLVKTAYAIRAFYGESQATGNDLISEWDE